MRQLFKDSEHLFRMAGLYAIGTASLFLLRILLVPADFGVYGHYRAGAIDDNRARPAVYAGREACAMCHDAIVVQRSGGAHEGIGCEACHGPLALHAEDPSTIPTALPRVGMLCENCHRANGARPEAFPQIDPEEHSGGVACNDCHNPHNPGFD